ncbi:MAG: redox-regulated ATPase YchF [Candidatus Hadarchaeales archaeon]
MLELGIVGKPNTGKTTLFNALTACNAPVAPYPFTTIEPNVGITYIRSRCPCSELGVKCNPQNSRCVEGTRFVPTRVIDVAGLIEGAHRGRGLGNRFLDSLRMAAVLIHVVDASGSTDSEGRPCEPGSHDPLQDLEFLEREIDLWLKGILSAEWERLERRAKTERVDFVEGLASRLSGLGITKTQIATALKEAGFDLEKFCSELRRISKPMLIAANKMDVQGAEKNIERLKATGRVVVPVSAEAELILRRAEERGMISYVPGASDFQITSKSLSPQQLSALEKVRELLKKWGSTGVQELVDKAIKEVLGMIVVYPVDDETKLTDKKGNVLPDAFLVPRGITAREFAYKIHTELGETFLYAINARTKMRLADDYQLRDGDIIRIVAAKGRAA